MASCIGKRFVLKFLIKIFLVLIGLLPVRYSYAQLVTNTAMSPKALVEDVLVGGGVTVSGVNFTGDPDAIGTFNGASTNLGLTSGIILTTGTVKNEVGGIGGAQRGPFGPNDIGSAGKANGQPGFGPLTTLAGVETHNAAILEFDFIPLSDTVRFRYVFGSDEYPEFVGEGFNDVFAFFISGPGFVGMHNMAQIPGVGGPVSIDNINNGPSNSGPCQNCAFYRNNGNGSNAPFNGSEFYIQYDGFTVVMEAVAKVQCGETYHLQIAIADAGDQAYDSGIFLEANSLESYVPLEMSAKLDFNGFGDGVTMAEGCESATITVTRKHTADELIIPIVALGTATEGVDYESLPTSVVFAPGVSAVTFTFAVFADALIEGTETLIIELNHPDPCGEDNFVRVNLAIRDVDPLEVVVKDESVHCPEDEIKLQAIVKGGLPKYDFVWDNGDINDAITVNPAITTTYTVTVIDECLGVPVSVSATVFVPEYPALIINTTDDITVLCPNTPQVLASEASGGDGVYTYEWTVGEKVISAAPFVNVSPFVTTLYTVKITDGCGTFISKDIMITVTASVLTLEMSPEQLICPGDSASIGVVASDGLGDYTYYWMHSGETLPNITVNPAVTTTYTVAVEDACHTYNIKGNVLVKVIKPTANFEVISSLKMEGLPVSFGNTSTGSVSWLWDLGNGVTSTSHSPTTTYKPAGWYEITLIAYNEIGCADTITKAIKIKPEFYFYAPNAFTPDNGRFNNYYEVSIIGEKEFEFFIFNRWGELIYSTTNPYFKWDGTYKGSIVPDDVMVYRVKIMDADNIVHDFEGIITILR